jgi:hypothetical protein
MSSDSGGLRRLFGSLLLVSAVACFAAGCSDITPEPNDEGGGVLESPTHEADSLREGEEREREGGSRP